MKDSCCWRFKARREEGGTVQSPSSLELVDWFTPGRHTAATQQWMTEAGEEEAATDTREKKKKIAAHSQEG